MASIDRAPIDEWLGRLEKSAASTLSELLARSAEQQDAAGYQHTLREICQQPETWIETAARMAAEGPRLEQALVAAGIRDRRGSLLLTGSGSSLFAGDCVAAALQEALRVPTVAVSAGALLTHPSASLPPAGPYLLVSFARSGNSPESCAVIDALKTPGTHHLIITCNAAGALARRYRDEPQVCTLVLSEATHDRSLVMTSSFTNMALAASALGSRAGFDAYRAATDRVATVARRLLGHDSQALAERARGRFDSVVYLGAGCRFGSARESALKMLEMTGGEIWTMAESFLGLRHGPMAAIGAQTLVVAHLSSEPVARAFELDLLRELQHKRLAVRPVIVGCAVPAELASEGGVIVDCGPASGLADVTLTLVDALAGQLLAFFSCLALGLKPDAPSRNGVIQRVVEEFEIHRRVAP